MSENSTLPDPDLAPYTWATIVAAMAAVENGWQLSKYSSMNEILIGLAFQPAG